MRQMPVAPSHSLFTAHDADSVHAQRLAVLRGHAVPILKADFGIVDREHVDDVVATIVTRDVKLVGEFTSRLSDPWADAAADEFLREQLAIHHSNDPWLFATDPARETIAALWRRLTTKEVAWATSSPERQSRTDHRRDVYKLRWKFVDEHGDPPPNGSVEA
jgi:hypothetical protein